MKHQNYKILRISALENIQKKNVKFGQFLYYKNYKLYKLQNFCTTGKTFWKFG